MSAVGYQNMQSYSECIHVNFMNKINDEVKAKMTTDSIGVKLET